MTPDFFNLSYLKTGSAIQQKGANVIEELEMMDILAAYDPVLAGTLPLDLFTPESDLDILCFSQDLKDTEMKWRHRFGTDKSFSAVTKSVKGIESLIASFNSGGFRFELFAQGIPTKQQTAYLHMVNEFKLLERYGKSLRDQILDMKRHGMKTEPAFALALKLPGDPYEALLKGSF